MNLSKLSLSQLVNLSLAVFLFLGIAATTYTVSQVNNLNAEAAKGGNGGGGVGGGKGGGKNGGSTGSICSTCTIMITSANPVPVGTAPSFHVTGYNPGDYVLMQMSNGYIRVDGVYAGADGSFNYTFYQPMTVPYPSYTMTASLLNGVNKTSITFAVQ